MRMDPTFSIPNSIPCFPNVPNSDSKDPQNFIWCFSKEFKKPLSNWIKGSEISFDSILLYLSPYLRCILAHKQSMLNSSSRPQKQHAYGAGMCLCLSCIPVGKQSWAILQSIIFIFAGALIIQSRFIPSLFLSYQNFPLFHLHLRICGILPILPSCRLIWQSRYPL